LELGENVVRLGGTLDEQYSQWRRILGQIIAIEQGGL